MEVDAINYLKYLYPEDLYVTDAPDQSLLRAKTEAKEELKQNLPEEIDEKVQTEPATELLKPQHAAIQEKTEEALKEQPKSTTAHSRQPLQELSKKKYDLIVILPEAHNNQPDSPEDELLKNIMAAIHIEAGKALRLQDSLEDEFIKQRIDDSECKICITFGTRSVKYIPKTADFYQIIEIAGVKFIHSDSLATLNLYVEQKRKLWNTLKTII
jgi:protein-tyrosine-phosphatase